MDHRRTPFLPSFLTSPQSPTHTNTDGIRGRTCSAIIALLELAAFFSPVSIIAFVPRFFFGGLLVLIALDLVLEWLWHSRRKMMGAEYAVALATFLAIGLTNIELGCVCFVCLRRGRSTTSSPARASLTRPINHTRMSIGVLLAVLAFALSYAEAPLALHPRVRHRSVSSDWDKKKARVCLCAQKNESACIIPLFLTNGHSTNATIPSHHSTVVRTFEERAVLSANQDKVNKPIHLDTHPPTSIRPSLHPSKQRYHTPTPGGRPAIPSSTHSSFQTNIPYHTTPHH